MERVFTGMRIAKCMRVNGNKANKVVLDSSLRIFNLGTVGGKMTLSKVRLPNKNFYKSKRNIEKVDWFIRIYI